MGALVVLQPLVDLVKTVVLTVILGLLHQATFHGRDVDLATDCVTGRHLGVVRWVLTFLSEGRLLVLLENLART